MIISHPQYTHTENSDKWLRAPWAHNDSQSKYTLLDLALATGSTHLVGAKLKVGQTDADNWQDFMIISHPQYTHTENSDKLPRAPWANNALQSK